MMSIQTHPIRFLTKPICFAVGIFVVSTSIAQSEPQSLGNDPVLASHLARYTVLDLGLRQVPSPSDYQLATTLLSIASDLDPMNAELARWVVEAAWSAGDFQAMMVATRRVIKADPRDTVAQLRLVSSVINQQQTVEGRLKLYDRFLGSAGKSLDVSVRSRLALDAALLERESGNVQGFAERLLLATKLDVSNKPAALLAAQFYSDATSDPVVLLEYQFKLLFADPLDANVHLTIARILAREGAYESSRRFLENSLALYKIESGRAPAMVEEIRLALNWQIDGAQRVLDDLNPILDDRRAEAQALIDSYIELELPTDDLLLPEEILYELGVDKLRLLASYHLGNQELTQRVLDDIPEQVDNFGLRVLSLQAQYNGLPASIALNVFIDLGDGELVNIGLLVQQGPAETKGGRVNWRMKPFETQESTPYAEIITRLIELGQVDVIFETDATLADLKPGIEEVLEFSIRFKDIPVEAFAEKDSIRYISYSPSTQSYSADNPKTWYEGICEPEE